MLLKFQKCLLCSGKCVCFASKSLQLINLILNFMFPNESEILHDSIKVSISLNKTLIFVSLAIGFNRDNNKTCTLFLQFCKIPSDKLCSNVKPVY